MTSLLIVGDSQTKYVNTYLRTMTSFKVTVDSVSGRKIQDVGNLQEYQNFNHLVVHLGTNNVPASERPAITIERMEKLIKQFRTVDQNCHIYISSILPRAPSDFAHCTMPGDRIEYLNEKANIINTLMEQTLTRFSRCHFINNDHCFKRGSTVRRELLSRDGLHLTPAGIQKLVGHMLSKVDDVLVSQVASFPTFCPPPTAFTPLSSSTVTSLSTSLSPPATSCVGSVLPPSQQSTSFRDVLLLPATNPVVLPKSHPASKPKSHNQGKGFRCVPPVLRLKPLPPSVKPVQPSPFSWQLVPRRQSSKVSCLSYTAHCNLHNSRFYSSTCLYRSSLSDRGSLVNTCSVCFPYSLLSHDSLKVSDISDSSDCFTSSFSRPHSSSKFSHSSSNVLNGKKKKRVGKAKGVGKQMKKKRLTSFKDSGVIVDNETKRFGRNDQERLNVASRFMRISVNDDRDQNVKCERQQVSEKIVVAAETLNAGVGAGWMFGRVTKGATKSSFIDRSRDFRCVCSGSFSQAHDRFGHSKNYQCVGISVINCIYVENVSRTHFTSSTIDDLIISGDELYRKTKSLLGESHEHAFLQVDEIPLAIDFQGSKYCIETTWIANELYAGHIDELVEKFNQLKNILSGAFLCDSQSAYIFIGLNSAVSFWKSGDCYFLFNSHSVDSENQYSVNGVGRLFSCSNLDSLASLLFSNQITVNQQYEITRVSSVPLVEPMEVVPTDGHMEHINAREVHDSNDMEVDIPDNDIDPAVLQSLTQLTNDMKLSASTPVYIDRKLTCKTYVVLEDISKLLIKNTSTEKNEKKIGRPKKAKRGRPSIKENYQEPSKTNRGRPTRKHTGFSKTSTLTREEQIRKSVKKYTEQHPDVNRNAAKRYTQSHPEINRNAAKRYTQSHPEINRNAAKRYTQSHPEINRNAAKRYTQSHPEINRNAAKRYTQTHPQINRIAVRKYKDSNVKSHLPTKLRKEGLIAHFSGEQLKLIETYTFKNPSLRADSTFKCPHCGARLFEEEKSRKKWCCSGNNANIQNLAPLQTPFYYDKEFLEHSVKYNNLFAFSALVIPGFQKLPQHGLSFIKILGRTYHKIYDLSYDGQQINTSRLFIDDGEERLKVGQEKNLNQNVIRSINTFLQSCNPFIPLYKTLHNEASENAHLVFEMTSRRTHGAVLGDRPSSNEVAAYISCDTEPYCPRKICVWKIGAAKPHTIDIMSSLLEPLTYPLLYPEGTPGWEIGRIGNLGKKLTLLKYTRCLLLSEERFSKFGRLSETWLVDMFARIDEERLRFIRYGQLKTRDGGLRTATADEIQAVITDNDATNVRNEIQNDETVCGEGGVSAGRIYLPSTYTGGPRYMKVSYMDAMALVSRLGGPTYFLTFTAYGGWDEIKLSKHKGNVQEPDVVNRVFQLKLDELLRDIRCGEFFGKLAYVVWVIEFQMRGLPHAHICFRVMDGGPVQGSEIDKVVRADIPKIDEPDTRLRDLVLKHMTHGPCGIGYRTDLPCWDEKTQKCTKRFPKPHVDTTYTDDRGYVQYKRDQTNHASKYFRGKQIQINDRWVVPYNAALLIKYNCHINLEIASARSVVKYLFKYISKGAPLRRVAIVGSEDSCDEVEEYITKRYIGSSDAAWRILEFKITGREPSVIHLPVHLEGKHSVFFRHGEEAVALERSSSLLIIYFNRPRSSETDNLTYLDFYENFIVHSKRPSSSSVPIFEHPDGKHFITARQRGQCVARMFWVAPTRGEQYYLRVLLSKYSCRGFSDLYLLGGPNCSNFQQAAKAVGLVGDNREYFDAMEEASQFMLANALRRFFVILLTEGCPATEMWEKYKNSLSEDFLLNEPDDPEKAYKRALLDIDRCLRRHRSSLFEAGLPVVEDDSTELGREKLQYSSSKQKEFVDEWESRLSPDQCHVLKHIKAVVDDPSSDLNRVLFIDGPGGSGKTLLLKVIAAYVRSLDRVVLCVASSGIAALNLSGGTTAHSMFRLPLDLPEQGYWSITNGSQRAELVREATLIIYDEAPMAHRYAIEMIDRSLRDLMRIDAPFGNKIMLFSGDFRQIPPVVKKARTPSDIVNASVRHSPLWSNVQKFELTTSHRMSGNVEYSRFLLQLGSNLVRHEWIGSSSDSQDLVALSQLSYVSDIHKLIEFVFPSQVINDPDVCSNRAILCTLNTNVDEFNCIVCNLLDGEEHNLYSFDKMPDEEDGGTLDIDESLLHHARGQGVPDHVLKLKVGSICLVMRNLSFDLGLVNGTKVIIVGITRRLITCRKPSSNDLFGIPRITFKFPLGLDSPIEMIRLQFPLKLAYAMTIHKSQGQTIDMVGLDLRTSCFTHGQLYVGLSRVRSPENILILVSKDDVINGVPYSKNIVYPGLL